MLHSARKETVMQEDYTHIAVILDRTGSMEAIRDDTIGGFNAFLKDQQSQPGRATLTLVQFDAQDPYEVIHRFKPIEDVPDLDRNTFVPRASTPLLDALGRGINDLEQSLSKLPEPERPARVMLVIVTDGRENSSREFKKAQIEKMIKERKARDDWNFVFLSADMDAIGDARDLGFDRNSVRAFEKSPMGTADMWKSLTDGTRRLRQKKKKKFGFDLDDAQDGKKG